jgi:transmembrane sensor
MSNLRRPIRELLRENIVEAQSLDATWQRIEARRKSRSVARRAVLPVLAGCCALLGLMLVVRMQHAPGGETGAAPGHGAEPLRWASGEALSPASAIEIAPAGAARVLALSDGTRISLAAGTRIVPQVSTGTRFELSVERGQARFEVQPQRGRSFAVSAGALRVEVVGTVFSVARGEHAAEVSVEHGRVRVHVPGADGAASSERLLGARESLRWPQEAPVIAPAVPATAPAEPAPAIPVAAPPSSPRTQPAAPASGSQQASAWRALAASGDYARAYAALGARGYARAVRAEHDTDALLQLADLARGAGQPHAAALALSSILERNPHGDQSALAALTLGRLDLDVLGQPKAAARALRIALAAGLPVGLQEDALARLVDACARAGEREGAEQAAEQYRKRFPNGRWRASVEQWVLAR